MPFIPLHDNTPRYLIAQPWTAWALVLVTSICFLGQVLAGDDGFLSLVYGLGVIPATLTGQAQLADDLFLIDPLATFLTYQFLHGDFMHLFGNMLYLWVFGDNVEDAMGHLRFLVFYLACGAVAGLAQILVDPGSTSPLIGASGAISGVLGAYLILHPRAKVLVPVVFIPLYLPAWLLLLFWFGFQFFALAGGQGDSNVGWWAHIGGFIAGTVLIPLFRYKAVPLFGLGDPPGGVTLRRGVGWQAGESGGRDKGGPWG
ncbi:rhomboid family intramembrane serine protease [Pelagibius litoralis]|uniref:Rhomboid family intramembrane serine protease n=1 Tax=Pelagibius litoralis TaxID=374515 RepID=A0A967C3F5_9PROT|nr:rhomboid family intramembrane serine protease [Pelagibius litoralis]NIA67530.1 rhomboid family intramembrane serine protease [Pelagibius litoralis]